MPKIICKCGEIIDYGLIPSKQEYIFIADTQYDEYEGQVESEELYKRMKSFLKCPKCRRLWFFWNGFQNPPTEYLPVLSQKPSEAERGEPAG